MSWVSFTDEAAFTAWHGTVCADHGIPHPGRNEATGAVDVDATWTTAYVAPVDDHGTIKAQVPDDDVTTYALTVTTAPVYYDEDGNPVADPPVPVTFDYTLDPGERLKDWTEINGDSDR